jgi:predicted nuclease of predicted toxin-antitoxin system
LPTELHRLLPGCEARTVQFMAWRGLSDRDLLAKAGSDFDVLLTADRGIEHQQRLQGRPIAVIVLPTSRLAPLLPLLERVLSAIKSAKPGSIMSV